MYGYYLITTHYRLPFPQFADLPLPHPTYIYRCKCPRQTDALPSVRVLSMRSPSGCAVPKGRVAWKISFESGVTITRMKNAGGSFLWRARGSYKCYMKSPHVEITQYANVFKVGCSCF